MTMSYDTQHLQRCRKQIEIKLGWPPAGEWRHFEFTELSEKIYDSTDVQLSPTTLKRIFGKVKYNSLPSSATLNTLARYIGYPNWTEFKTAEETPAAVLPGEKELEREHATPRFHKKTWMAVAAVITLVVICGFVFLPGPTSSSVSLPGNIIFTSKPLAEGLPNSVVFHIGLAGIRSNDILIQQSWDSTRTVRLNKGQTEATAIYYIPGYFRAKLIVDKKIVKEHDLFIRSDQWMATIDQDNAVPRYVKKEELVLNQGMHVIPPVITQIKEFTQPAILTYHLVRPFADLHSDHFTLETSFQNTLAEGSAVCKTSKVFILCTNGAFIIPFTIKGCVSDINLKFGETVWPGKSNDLSAFGIDPANTIALRLEVKNRKVKIFCNGKMIREGSYPHNMGDIVGLRYSFFGAGIVNYTRLLNENAVVVYNNDFR